MRSKIICLALAFCLVLSLTACRRSNNNTGSSAGDNMGQQNDSGSSNNSTGTDDSGSLVQDAVDGAKNSARSFSRSMTGDFDRMMDNARVHDSDGILTDGENPTNNTFRR